MRRFPLSLMSVRRRGSVSVVARRSRRLDIGYGCGDVGMEPLEARVLLTGPAALMTPLPDISLLESSSNPVVRFQTNFGVIDMELFPDTAPGIVENFLDYVYRGDFDESFFHRLVPNFVLQGGGFRYKEPTEDVTRIPTQDPVQNEFNRSNLQWTVAMARLGNQPNSATSQWFINLVDNVGLDTVDGIGNGFSVFGRILSGASRTTVTTISQLTTADFRDYTLNQFGQPVSLLPGGDPDTVALGEVPVLNTPTVSPGDMVPSDTIVASDLVVIFDAEVIKPGTTTLFYEHRLYYAEGFSGPTITEFLPLGNPNSQPVQYQVIARAETDREGDRNLFRDRVIATGTIAANSRGGITVSRQGDFRNPDGSINPLGTGENLLPGGVPYSLEVWSTRPLGAQVSHFDFEIATGEAFTPELATTWAFAAGLRSDAQQRDFLVWSNPTEQVATIRITFYFESGNPVTIAQIAQPYRRGGLNINQVTAIPEGARFSAVMQSDVPIVAAITRFKVAGDREGSASLGAPSTASDVGVLPGVFYDGTPVDGPDQILTFINPNNQSAVINLDFVLAENTVVRRGAAVLIPPNQRRELALSSLLLNEVPPNSPFTVRYDTLPVGNGVRVYAHAATLQRTDEVANPIAAYATTQTIFAEGFMIPFRAGIDVFEDLVVYNPNVFGSNRIATKVTVRLLYSDGFVLSRTIDIPGGGFYHLALHEDQEILDNNRDNQRFFFSIDVQSELPVVSQFFHYDLTLGANLPSGGFSTLGTPLAELIRLTALEPPIVS